MDLVSDINCCMQNKDLGIENIKMLPMLSSLVEIKVIPSDYKDLPPAICSVMSVTLIYVYSGLCVHSILGLLNISNQHSVKPTGPYFMDVTLEFCE